MIINPLALEYIRALDIFPPQIEQALIQINRLQPLRPLPPIVNEPELYCQVAIKFHSAPVSNFLFSIPEYT